jgi:hypothetical protein
MKVIGKGWNPKTIPDRISPRNRAVEINRVRNAAGANFDSDEKKKEF